MYSNNNTRSVGRSISPIAKTSLIPRPIINRSSISIKDEDDKIQLIPRPIINRSSIFTKDEDDKIPFNTNVRNNKIHDLVLREWQVEWAKHSQNILLSNHFYIDTSPMRSGKTFVALHLAKAYNLELMVICPLTTKNYWKNMANKYGISLFTDPINYEALVRGTKNEVVQLYLKRIENRTHVNFVATETYIEALKNRQILLILDEGQMIKNDCLQHKACNALIKPILTNEGRSRFGILSGTLIDKPEQIINLFRTIGYIRSRKLYNTIKGNKILNLLGAQELIDVCEQIDPIATENFLVKVPIPTVLANKKTKYEIEDFCFALYVDIIKPKVSGAMSAPTTSKGELYVKNGYFHILPEKAKQLENALAELKYSVGYNKKNSSSADDEDPKKPSIIGNYIKSLVQIEKSKLYDMSRVAKKLLSSDPTNKVIITINYTGSETGNLDELLGYLSEYDPLVITGKTNVNKRDIIIEEFNDDPTRRILIANPKPISVGISLVGDGQRFMLVSPSSKLMEIVQLSSRIYGDQLMIDSYVYIFYAIIGGNLEANILEFMGTNKLRKNAIDTDIKGILEKKSDILGKMQDYEIRKNMKLPSDYEDEYEDPDEVYY